MAPAVRSVQPAAVPAPPRRPAARPERKLSLRQSLQRDLEAIFARDPAVRSRTEVFIAYPGLHALWGHRLAHWCWVNRHRLLARWLSHVNRFLTGIEIHPGATLGPGLFIDHGMGVVIGETAEVGRDVTLYHGVTLGGVSSARGKRHPTIEDNVVIGGGAKVLGAITVGAGSRIGANAVVVKDVPPNSVVVGVPGQVVLRSRPVEQPGRPDLEHNRLPDTFGAALKSLLERVQELEDRLDAVAHTHTPPHHVVAPDPKDRSLWHGEDFQI